MRVTNVRLQSAANQPEHNCHLVAFVTLEFDGSFVVRDCKLIRLRDTGRLMVAMPTRKQTARCGCGDKNTTDARYCNWCGCCLPPVINTADIHRDVCHPVRAELRGHIEQVVLAEYLKPNQGRLVS